MASTSTQELQKQLLTIVRNSQKVARGAVTAWVETVQNVSAKLPSATVPLAGRLPKPHDVVTKGYDFAEQMLSSQRKFANEVLKATAPLRPRLGRSEPKAAGPGQSEPKATVAEHGND
jgi:hypothetical protein